MAAFERLHDRDSAEPVISGPGRIKQAQMTPRSETKHRTEYYVCKHRLL